MRRTWPPERRSPATCSASPAVHSARPLVRPDRVPQRPYRLHAHALSRVLGGEAGLIRSARGRRSRGAVFPPRAGAERRGHCAAAPGARDARARGHAVTILTGPLDAAAAPLERALRRHGHRPFLMISRRKRTTTSPSATPCSPPTVKVIGRYDRVVEYTRDAPAFRPCSSAPSLPAVLQVDKLIFASRGLVERVWSRSWPGAAGPRRGHSLHRPTSRRRGAAATPHAGRVVCIGACVPANGRRTSLCTVGLLIGRRSNSEVLEMEAAGREVIGTRPDRFE